MTHLAFGELQFSYWLAAFKAVLPQIFAVIFICGIAHWFDLFYGVTQQSKANRYLRLFVILGLGLFLLFITHVSLPMTLLNAACCVLFIWLKAEFERGRMEKLIRQAELSALRAQIEPHFLNGALNDLTEIISSDPHNAITYVCELADFFNHTREFSAINCLPLEQEMQQVNRYLNFKRLSYGDNLQISQQIPAELLSYLVLSDCLLILVENVLKYAFIGQQAPFKLFITAEKSHNRLVLSVRDNGRGFTPALFSQLGGKAISADRKGSGIALYQLNRRLNHQFGKHAQIHFSNAAGAVVRITHPLQLP